MQDNNYFRLLRWGMDNGGREELLALLLAIDLTEWTKHSNPRQIPTTPGLVEQKVLSGGAEMKWLFDRLWQGAPLSDGGGWQTEVSNRALYSDYLKQAKDTNQSHPLSQVEFGRRLRQLIPAIKDKKVSIPTHDYDRTKRVPGVQLPYLVDARAAFDRVMGMPNEWPPIVEEATGEDS
jgi:hypothetical protein